MHFGFRTIGPIAFFSCIVGSAAASGMGSGGADNQLWVLNTGNDITYFTEPLSYVLPNLLSGSGSANGTTTTNNPPSGGTYYNTNSFALVTSDGSAYVESGEGDDYFFTNNSNTAETVELGWQGFITTSSTAAGNGFAIDYASSYVLDAETNTFAFNLNFETGEPGGTASYSNSDSGDYTFTVAAGQQEYEIQVLAYNEAEVISPAATPEPAPLAALGLGALGVIIRKKRNR